MNAKTAIARYLTIGIFVALTSACTIRPNIISARAHRAGDNVVIELELDSREAAIIKSKQIYFSATIFDCNGSLDGYPATPYIDGERASMFKFSTTSPVVNITGNVPTKVFDRYHSPCVYLGGGSYLLRKMRSLPVPIKQS